MAMKLKRTRWQQSSCQPARPAQEMRTVAHTLSHLPWSQSPSWQRIEMFNNLCLALFPFIRRHRWPALQCSVAVSVGCSRHLSCNDSHSSIHIIKMYMRMAIWWGGRGRGCCGGDAADKRIWAINITLVVSFSVMKRVDEFIDPVLW